MSASMDKYWELLSAYIDGEVTDEERTEVERILAEDQEAAALFNKLSATRNMLSSMQSLSAPPRIRHNLSHAIRSNRSFFARMRRLVKPKGFRIPVVAYAGSALVIVLAILISIVIPPTTQAPTTEMVADADLRSIEETQQDAERTNEFALRFDDDEKVDEPAAQPREMEEESPDSAPQEEMLAEFESDAEGGADRSGVAPPRQEESNESITVSGEAPIADVIAPEPVLVMAAEQPPMYRAEVIQAYQDGQDEVTDSKDYFVSSYEKRDFAANQDYERAKKAEDIVKEPAVKEYSKPSARLATRRRADSMEKDSEPNSGGAQPSSEPIDLGYIAIPVVDFPYYQPTGAGSVLISGVVNVGADGLVNSYRISGPDDAKELIDMYGSNLAGTLILPVLENGQPIPAQYNFIATIYRIEEPID